MLDPLASDPALLEALPDAVVVADRAGRIAYVNPAIGTLLGYTPAELTGEPLQVLMPVRFRHAHGDGFSRFRATGNGPLVGSTTRVPALHAAGHEIQIDLTLARLTPTGQDDDALVVAVLRDARTTVLMERQLEVGRYLAATLRVTTALTEASDADAAFEGLLPTLCEHLDWDAACLWQPDGARLTCTGSWSAPGAQVENLRTAAFSRTFERGAGLPGLAWQQGSASVVPDLWSEQFLRSAAARADGLRTGMAFPVVQGDTTLAVIELFSREIRPVPPELVDVLTGAGRQIGQYLARLQAEAEVRRLADTLQRSFLPSRLPTIPGVEIAAGYRAGGQESVVGGDTYDVMALPNGHWMVLIADVCGTGPAAAASTALTRHTARAVAAVEDPAGILGAVNSALLAENATAGFVTACCLVLSPEQPAVALTLAGHPQPLLRTAAGVVEPLGRPGVPLGLGADAEYRVERVALAPGDTLVLYTDGVTEARDVHGEQFGEAALCDLLRTTAGASPEETVAAVRTAVDEHLAGSRRATDDLAVLALRV